jgi:tRNA pseudouridine38-40 synthase
MKQYYYLVHIQYLGYRFHGWQKQPGLKTIEFMIEKTAGFVLGHTQFKILGTSRTDAKVSANHSAFELFVNDPLDIHQLLRDFNQNLPNDIRVIKIEAVDKHFNIINTPKIKEYLYLFSFGKKSHPFCAPLISSFQNDLDIDLMKKGALLFKGSHNFVKYCTKPAPGKIFEKTILVSKIQENKIFKANFFPKKTYVYHIHSKGFMRYQVRLIMGQLLSLGRGEIQLDDIKECLKGKDNKPLRHIAPSSGLILNKIRFDTGV